MKKQYRKSDLNILDDGNIKLLTNKHHGLIECECTVVTAENIELSYNLKGQSLVNTELKPYERLQVLYKLAKMVTTELKMLEFKLSPNNIYVLNDGDVLICERKITIAPAKEREAKLLRELIALAGYLIDKQDYQSLLEVDNVQLEGSKNLKGLLDVKSLAAACNYLDSLVTNELETLHKERVIISKSKYKTLSKNKLFYRASLAVAIILIIVLCGYIIPLKSKKIELYEASQNSDSTKILKLVQKINIGTMSKNEKIVADKAIINDQVELNDDQKSNIIGQLNTKTKDDILDYWMYIGKGEFDEANNSAIAVSDADMQIYALLLLINEAQNDDELDATERKELIDGYESQITDLTAKKEEASEDEE